MNTYLTLQQLLLNIQGQLRQAFPGSYWIKAELAGVRRVGSHVYFELIQISSGQKVAQIKGTAFYGEGTQAIHAFEQTTGQRFTEGIKIGLRAAVSYHPVYGLSLNLLELDAELTIGGIELQRKQTLDLLLRNNAMLLSLQDGVYITPNKLLPLPPVVQKVAIITSKTSDAYADLMHCLETNDHGYRFHTELYEALVHGYNAAASIMEALGRIKASGIRYDVVILTRGGGAPADFLPFDDYDLALNIALFPTPILTGIGHQMNQGIADFFARVHMKTPTMAAQFLIDHNHLFEKRLSMMSGAINQTATSLMAYKNSRFMMLQSRLGSATKEALQHKCYQLRNVESGLYPATFRLLKNQDSKIMMKSAQISFRLPFYFAATQKNLLHLKEHIQSLSPDRLLRRGFAMIRKDGSYVVGSELNEGDNVEIVLHKESYEAAITRKL
jgi:exodeoxyribonuclease VII large subunit